MNENIKTSDVERTAKLAAAISSLPESEIEKLNYIAEGIKLANCTKSA